MTLPIRRPIVDYVRDTYLRRLESSEIPVGGVRVRAAEEEEGPVETIDCATGCGQWGLSPLASEALRTIDSELIASYPERSYGTLLKPEILARYKTERVTEQELFFGHGSFNLIERVIHKFLKADAMVGIGPQFTEIPSEFISAGGSYLPLPLTAPDFRLPTAELEAVVARGQVSILYIDNPNNPLGQSFDLGDIERLAATCDRHSTVLLVDEAWGDFLDDSLSAVHLVGSHDSMIVVRSFSKALGLAAERVGYMFMSRELAKHYRQIDVPFEPGLVGATLARETIRDSGFIEHVRTEARAAKAEIKAALASAGLLVLPTHDSVSILGVHAPARNIVHDFEMRGVLVRAGSAFVRTHAQWDDSYCRLRVVRKRLLPLLCDRIAALR